MIVPLLAVAAVIPACPYPGDSPTIIATKRELPALIATAIGELAERGAAFQVSDSLKQRPHPPFARFVSAAARGCDLTLHYEHGGIVHTWMSMYFRFERGRWTMLSRVGQAR